jgi:sialate O-acetylesterase
MAVLTDIGDRKNVHPKNKQDVGDRLARIALACTYGQPIEYSGPVFQSAKPEDHAIRITFTHASELVAKTSQGDYSTTQAVGGFSIAGADGKSVPAAASIDHNSILVSSPDVPQPRFVRYGWSNFPEDANLYNESHLPAAQFRTDPK